MQFLAAGSVYLAAHDPAGHSKFLSWAVTNASAEATAPAALHDVPEFDGCLHPLLAPTAEHAGARGATRRHALAVTTVVENAGATFDKYALPFPIALGVVAEKPLWFGAAQTYRDWAIPSAAWTAAGPVSERPDVFPDWLLDTQVWINSGWQCLDRFNASQGDPATAAAAAAVFAKRVNLSTPPAYHHYEWQCGPLDKDACADPAATDRFRFDTEYPDYFPARGGFSDAVKRLKDETGVRTLPYVNARLFDVQCESYLRDDGGALSARQPPNPALGAVGGDLCSETYGSFEANGSVAAFAVADPSTEYWQNAYGDVVDRLVNDEGVDGVYLDQLGASPPVLDWTVANRSHLPGGGAWWRTGVKSVFDEARRRAPGAPLVTESNAETVMDVASGLLTIEAFSNSPLVQDGAEFLAPAFPAVYGGFYNAFGGMFSRADFAPNADVLAARLAAQFVYGAQLGWMSLGGVTSGTDLDTGCGPMGTSDLWLSEAHDDEVAYLQLLAACRAASAPYFVHGRLAKTPAVSSATFSWSGANDTIPPRNAGPFPALFAAAWVTPATGPVASARIFFSTTTQSDQPANVTLQTTDYFGTATDVTVYEIDRDGAKTQIGASTDGVVRVDRSVPGRSVAMLELVPS